MHIAFRKTFKVSKLKTINSRFCEAKFTECEYDKLSLPRRRHTTHEWTGACPVIAITNNKGKVVASYTYDAWGVCTIVSDSSGISTAFVSALARCAKKTREKVNAILAQVKSFLGNVGRATQKVIDAIGNFLKSRSDYIDYYRPYYLPLYRSSGSSLIFLVKKKCLNFV